MSHDRQPASGTVWGLGSLAHVRLRQWGIEAVLYDVDSGDTFLIEGPVQALLDLLAHNGAMTPEGVWTALLDRGEMDQGVPPGRVEALLEHLDGLGIVQEVGVAGERV